MMLPLEIKSDIPRLLKESDFNIDYRFLCVYYKVKISLIAELVSELVDEKIVYVNLKGNIKLTEEYQKLRSFVHTCSLYKYSIRNDQYPIFKKDDFIIWISEDNKINYGSIFKISKFDTTNEYVYYVDSKIDYREYAVKIEQIINTNKKIKEQWE